MKAKDTLKDQSFFLSQVNQFALQKTMFPLSDFTKSEVKNIAKENGFIDIAKRKESMGICFIGSRNFGKFISEVRIIFFTMYLFVKEEDKLPF